MMHRGLTLMAGAALVLATAAQATPPALTLMPPSPPQPPVDQPGLGAPLYSTDPKVECDIAVAAVRMTRWAPVDPLLRGTDTEGSVDCTAAFQTAGIAIKTAARLHVTRPRLAPNGKPYVAVSYQDGHFRKGMGFDAEQQDGTWIVDEPVIVWMT